MSQWDKSNKVEEQYQKSLALLFFLLLLACQLPYLPILLLRIMFGIIVIFHHEHDFVEANFFTSYTTRIFVTVILKNYYNSRHIAILFPLSSAPSISSCKVGYFRWNISVFFLLFSKLNLKRQTWYYKWRTKLEPT